MLPRVALAASQNERNKRERLRRPGTEPRAVATGWISQRATDLVSVRLAGAVGLSFYYFARPLTQSSPPPDTTREIRANRQLARGDSACRK